MFVFSFLWDRYSPELKAHQKTYRPIIKKRDSTFDYSIANRLKENISEDEKAFLLSLLADKEKSKKSLQAYTKKKRELQKSQKFLGRSNFKFWFDQFGKELKSLFFAALLLLAYYRYKLPKPFKWAGVMGISASLFVFYFLIFKTAEDFYDNTYILFEVALSGIAGILAVEVGRYLIKRQSFFKTIQSLFTFINEEAEQEDYVKEEKKSKFRKRRVELLHDAVGIKDKD
jgi:hypothetical protein